MNYTIMTADIATRMKIVLVALVGSIAVAWIGVARSLTFRWRMLIMTLAIGDMAPDILKPKLRKAKSGFTIG